MKTIFEHIAECKKCIFCNSEIYKGAYSTYYNCINCRHKLPSNVIDDTFFVNIQDNNCVFIFVRLDFLKIRMWNDLNEKSLSQSVEIYDFHENMMNYSEEIKIDYYMNSKDFSKFAIDLNDKIKNKIELEKILS